MPQYIRCPRSQFADLLERLDEVVQRKSRSRQLLLELRKRQLVGIVEARNRRLQFLHFTFMLLRQGLLLSIQLSCPQLQDESANSEHRSAPCDEQKGGIISPISLPPKLGCQRL